MAWIGTPLPAGDGSTSMSSWLSHGCPWPCQTCTKRTPCSSSRRAMSICRPCVPVPYMSRIVLRLPADVEGVGGVHLHAIGQLERLDAGFELGVLLALLLMPFVELPAAGRAAAAARRCRRSCCGCSRSAYRASVLRVSM